MTGIYLKCDKCGATLGGEEVCSREHGLHWSERATLREEAIKRGWRCNLGQAFDTPNPDMHDNVLDLCPRCAKLYTGGPLQATQGAHMPIPGGTPVAPPQPIPPISPDPVGTPTAPPEPIPPIEPDPAPSPPAVPGGTPSAPPEPAPPLEP